MEKRMYTGRILYLFLFIGLFISSFFLYAYARTPWMGFWASILSVVGTIFALVIFYDGTHYVLMGPNGIELVSGRTNVFIPFNAIDSISIPRGSIIRHMLNHNTVELYILDKTIRLKNLKRGRDIRIAWFKLMCMEVKDEQQLSN